MFVGFCFSTAHGFTLDFATIPAGTTFPPDLTVAIPGYGDVKLYAGNNGDAIPTPLQIGTNHGPSTVEFDAGDVFYIDFLTGGVSEFSLSSLGEDDTELFIFDSDPTQTRFQIVLSGTGEGGAGVTSIDFTTTTAIPEPGSSALGLLGAAGFILRRRRI